MNPDLSSLNPTGRFTDRAADYVRFRPTYPPEAIDALLAGLGLPDRLVAADVGAGTGISARLLADRGCRVTAVEPNAAMRSAAEPHPRVTWHEGEAEATRLPETSFDLVLAAQSFHWFRQRDALREFHRILKPAARLALMWNQRDPGDPLTLGYINAIVEVNGEHPVEQRLIDSSIVTGDGLFTNLRRLEFPNFQELTLEGLLGRARSASYVPREGDRWERLRSILTGLHARHADDRGTVRLCYVTRLYLADRA